MTCRAGVAGADASGAEQSTKEVTRHRLEDGVDSELEPVGAAAASE